MPSGVEPLELEALEALVQRRRTSLLLDPGQAVPPELVERLVRVVGWAPNHKRTWPWRIAVVTGDGRRRLGELVADFERRGGADAARIEKALTKYLRAPVIVLLGRADHPDPVRRREDRDAVAAGVQNLLLAATAAGLASHWATGDWMSDAAIKSFAGLEPHDELVALVYLGWPTGAVPAVERPEPRVAYVDN
jgi:nitroreductase